MKIQSFKQLEVWKKGLDIVDLVYEATGAFPSSERYALAYHLQRTSTSIPSNIAEGFARQHTKEYIQFCYIALGSCAELETQLTIAKRRGFLSAERFSMLEEHLDHEGRMLNNLIKSLKASPTSASALYPDATGEIPPIIHEQAITYSDLRVTNPDPQTTIHKQRSTIHDMSFTLIEVLVAITLTAILVIAATGIWIGCTRGWSFAREHQRVTGHDDLVTGRVRELFERAMLEKSSRDLFEWKCENNFDGQFPADRISFTTQWPMELERGRTLLVPVRGSLGIQAAPAGGKKLTWSFAPFSIDPRNADEAETIVLSPEIRSFNLRYWWKDAGRWVEDWREEKKWPQAVEVELTFADSKNAPREHKFVITLPPPAEPVSTEKPAATPAPSEPGEPS